jgi:hypothetical protein
MKIGRLLSKFVAVNHYLAPADISALLFHTITVPISPEKSHVGRVNCPWTWGNRAKYLGDGKRSTALLEAFS